MEKALRKNIIMVSIETTFIISTVAFAILLPQILHIIGATIGIGGALGQIFLPMYLPILVIGFYRGPLTGAVAGLLAPIVSFSLTNMPQSAILPFITIELIATGLFAGMFKNVKSPAVLRVFLVQVLAKAVRLIAFALSLYFASGNIKLPTLFSGILMSIPGIILQLVLVSLLIKGKGKNTNE